MMTSGFQPMVAAGQQMQTVGGPILRPGATMPSMPGNRMAPMRQIRMPQTQQMQMPTYPQYGAPAPQQAQTFQQGYGGPAQTHGGSAQMQPPFAMPQPAVPVLEQSMHQRGVPQQGPVGVPPGQPVLPIVMGPAAMPPPPADSATEAVDHDLKVGEWVKFKGIAANPEYQHAAFQVEVPNVGDGRVLVKFQKSVGLVKKLYFDPSVLERADPEPHEVALAGGGVSGVAGSAPVVPMLALSGRFRIVGLGRPEHEGKIGVVMPPGYPDAHGHVKVKLDGVGGATILDLPPTYLEQVHDAPAVAAPTMIGQDVAGISSAGEKVQIVNLASRPQHNGRTGEIESMDANGGIIVKLDHVDADGVCKLALNLNHVQSLDVPQQRPVDFAA